MQNEQTTERNGLRGFKTEKGKEERGFFFFFFCSASLGSSSPLLSVSSCVFVGREREMLPVRPGEGSSSLVPAGGEGGGSGRTEGKEGHYRNGPFPLGGRGGERQSQGGPAAAAAPTKGGPRH